MTVRARYSPSVFDEIVVHVEEDDRTILDLLTDDPLRWQAHAVAVEGEGCCHISHTQRDDFDARPQRYLLTAIMCLACIVSLWQLAEPLCEKPSLRFLPGEGQRPFVGGSGFCRSPEAPAEIRPRRVRQVIVLQVASGEDRVDEGKSCHRAVAHRHRDRAIQRDHG
jgi:hypothetical protein